MGMRHFVVDDVWEKVMKDAVRECVSLVGYEEFCRVAVDDLIEEDYVRFASDGKEYAMVYGADVDGVVIGDARDMAVLAIVHACPGYSDLLAERLGLSKIVEGKEPPLESLKRMREEAESNEKEMRKILSEEVGGKKVAERLGVRVDATPEEVEEAYKRLKRDRSERDPCRDFGEFGRGYERCWTYIDAAESHASAVINARERAATLRLLNDGCKDAVWKIRRTLGIQ